MSSQHYSKYHNNSYTTQTRLGTVMSCLHDVMSVNTRICAKDIYFTFTTQQKNVNTALYSMYDVSVKLKNNYPSKPSIYK